MTTATVTTRKARLSHQLRPVNIIQHDDAGPSEEPTSAGEPETIELPPAYTNIRSTQRPLTLLLLRRVLFPCDYETYSRNERTRIS